MDPTLYRSICDHLLNGTMPSNADEAEALSKLAKAYSIQLDPNTNIPRLYFKHRLVATLSEAPHILRLLHDNTGHLGIDNTLEKVRRRHYWPHMDRDVRAYVLACPVCQLYQPVRRAEPLHPIPVHHPFHRIGIDLVSGLPSVTLRKSSTVVHTIAVAVDYLTKWAIAAPLASHKASDVADFIYHSVILQHGCPIEILSDNGPEFTASVTEELLERFRIRHVTTTPYHPQGNGLTERTNRTLISALRKLSYYEPGRWPEYLPLAVFSYNTMKHSATGHTPFYLLKGYEATMPTAYVDGSVSLAFDHWDELFFARIASLAGLAPALKQAKLNIEKSQQKQAQRHNRKIRQTDRDIIRVDAPVLVRRSALDNSHSHKLEARWDNDIAYVTNDLGHGVYAVEHPSGAIKHYHRSRLVPYFFRPSALQPPSDW